MILAVFVNLYPAPGDCPVWPPPAANRICGKAEDAGGLDTYAGMPA
jgi:hypothetical protein